MFIPGPSFKRVSPPSLPGAKGTVTLSEGGEVKADLSLLRLALAGLFNGLDGAAWMGNRAMTPELDPLLKWNAASCNYHPSSNQSNACVAQLEDNTVFYFWCLWVFRWLFDSQVVMLKICLQRWQKYFSSSGKAYFDIWGQLNNFYNVCKTLNWLTWSDLNLHKSTSTSLIMRIARGRK